ncbi:ParB/RepB/Spo0J family partition protein, partial [Candidatus Peregrinibacteria bacterium]|nr:ParB/RepB/Spo0J family partition protein [Candidatus Peregrinibacteria bacterium]
MPLEELRQDRTELVQSEQITEHGEILQDDSQLVRIPDCEGSSRDWPIEMFVENPDQPRRVFDESKMAQLTEFIDEDGQTVPIIAVPLLVDATTGEIRFLVVDGARRLRACQRLEYKVINAKIVYHSTTRDVFIGSLILNISQEDLNPIELATAYAELVELATPEHGGKAAKVIAKRIGIGASVLYKYLQMLDFPDAIQEVIVSGIITLS